MKPHAVSVWTSLVSWQFLNPRRFRTNVPVVLIDYLTDDWINWPTVPVIMGNSTHPRNESLDNITQVDVKGSPIPISDSIKLLGVTIDSSLAFNEHVSLICMSVLSVPHPSSSPLSSHPRCQHRQTGWPHFGELPTRLCQLYHVWHVKVPDRYKLQRQQNMLARVV